MEIITVEKVFNNRSEETETFTYDFVAYANTFESTLHDFMMEKRTLNRLLDNACYESARKSLNKLIKHEKIIKKLINDDVTCDNFITIKEEYPLLNAFLESEGLY
jgi:hypothetical protein